MILRRAVIVAFVVMGLLMLREAFQGADEAEGCDLSAEELGSGQWSWAAFGLSAALLLGAEMGDKTQLAVLTLASQQAQAWSVFMGGALALTAVTAIGTWAGQSLASLVPQRLMLKLAGAAFILMGLAMWYN